MPYLHKSIRVHYLCQDDQCQQKFAVTNHSIITWINEVCWENDDKAGETTGRHSLKNKKDLLGRLACSRVDAFLSYPIRGCSVFMWIRH